MQIIVLLVLLISVYYNGCNGKSCTCRVSTQADCEAAGHFSYDQIGNIKTQCSWEASHHKCRNTQWLQCKQDPKCIWIHKVTNEAEPEAEPEAEYNAPDDDDNHMNFPCGIDQQVDDAEDILFVYSDTQQSIQTQSDNIRIFTLCIVVIAAIIGGIYHFSDKKKKGDALFGLNQYQTYSTF